ncbi:ABC transporter permease [Streptomyces sp. NPDC007172]|uniref:ABC transporter permease n=1 Tax=Streptomyces sp. NPDC007172 TaxID=3364776 RepID=UPI0036801295
MSERGASRQLMRVGLTAGRGAEAGRVRFVALMAATALLALGIAAMVVVHASYQGQAQRGAARHPITQEERPDLPATALWSKATDSVAHGGSFSVVFIAPLTAHAPLPPGLDAWPAPGEAVLSPGLRTRGAADGIATRYGHAVGHIGVEGLQSPDELLAYVRPRAGLSVDEARNVVGYGTTPHAEVVRLGQLDDARPEWAFQTMPGLLVLLPVMVLLVVAARSGSRSRDRRTALVDALGGTSRARALIVLGETGVPVLAGAVIATAVVGAFWATDVPVPVTGFVVSAHDVRAHGGELALAVVTATVAVVTASVGAARLTPTAGGNRPTGARGAPTRWAALCPVFLLIAVFGPRLWAAGTSGNVLTNWAGAACTLATLPAAIAVLAALLGQRMSRAGSRFGRPGLLVAGQRMATHPGPLARMTAGLVIALALLIQIVAWQGLFGAEARAAKATVERIGSSALVVQPRTATTPRQMADFVRELPPTVEAVRMIRAPERSTVTLEGTCRGLTSLQLPCGAKPVRVSGALKDQRAREIVEWSASGTDSVTVRETAEPADVTASTPGEAPLTVLVSVDGHALSVPALKQLAYRVLPRGLAIDTAGGEWLTRGEIKRGQGLWISCFGFVGILVLAGVSVISGTAEFLCNGRALAPISVLAGNRRVHWSTAAWSLLVPFTLAGGIGCLVGTWLAYPKTADGTSYISGSFLALCGLGVSAMGLLAWGWGAHVAGRQAGEWRPRGD